MGLFQQLCQNVALLFQDQDHYDPFYPFHLNNVIPLSILPKHSDCLVYSFLTFSAHNLKVRGLPLQQLMQILHPELKKYPQGFCPIAQTTDDDLHQHL